MGILLALVVVDVKGQESRCPNTRASKRSKFNLVGLRRWVTNLVAMLANSATDTKDAGLFFKCYTLLQVDCEL